MRIRLRAPGGASTITLPEDATISDLIAQITEKTQISNFDVKYGYPPKPLLLSQQPRTSPLSELEVKLNGEQLTISAREDMEPASRETEVAQKLSQDVSSPGFSFADGTLSSLLNKKQSKPIALKKKDMSGKEVPEIPMPERGATLVLRVMPDDNSCLFRAFGTAIVPGDDQSMPELRSLVASAIQSDPETYTQVVLEQAPDDYCRWIQTQDAWGGAVEMQLLAKHFEVEICSIDVKSLRIDTFNPGASTRCILVYSGIHYDTIVQSPSHPPHTRSTSSPDYDIRVWPSTDEVILTHAIELCRKLQDQGYFTDTGGMPIKCNSCGVISYGEGQASGHAMATGHFDMEELPTTATASSTS